MTEDIPIEFERKYLEAIQELKESTIWGNNSLPPVHRYLRKLGVRVRPPHYYSFQSNLVRMSAYFSVFFGLPVWLFVLDGISTSVPIALLRAVLTGLFFGLLMSVYYWGSTRTHGLSTWEDL